jgi:hypothetical protein
MEKQVAEGTYIFFKNKTKRFLRLMQNFSG